MRADLLRGGRRGGRRAPACGRSRSSPPSARRRRPASTRSRRSPTCARGTACGCTSTPRTAARRRSCPEMRHVLDGCDRADSLVVNPHKWLLHARRLQPALHRAAGRSAGGLLARARVPDDARGRRRRQPDGLRALARPPVPRAQAVDGDPRLRRRGPGGAHRRATSSSPAAWRPRSSAEPGWELLAPVPFSTVCFRRHPPGVDDEDELRRLNTGHHRARERRRPRRSSRTPTWAAATPSAWRSGTWRRPPSTWTRSGSSCARPQRQAEPGSGGPGSEPVPGAACDRFPSAELAHDELDRAGDRDRDQRAEHAHQLAADQDGDEHQERRELHRLSVDDGLEDVVLELLVDDVHDDHDDPGRRPPGRRTPRRSPRARRPSPRPAARGRRRP